MSSKCFRYDLQVFLLEEAFVVLGYVLRNVTHVTQSSSQIPTCSFSVWSLPGQTIFLSNSIWHYLEAKVQQRKTMCSGSDPFRSRHRSFSHKDPHFSCLALLYFSFISPTFLNYLLWSEGFCFCPTAGQRKVGKGTSRGKGHEGHQMWHF